MYWESFAVLSVCSFILFCERLWRFRHESSTLTQKTFLVALFSLGVAAVAYGTMPLTAPFYNIGLGTWHALVGVLIGCLEMLVLALRNEQVTRSAVRAVLWRSSLVTIVLAVTYVFGFAGADPLYNLSASGPRNVAVLVHLIVFPTYILWGLIRIIDLCRRRFLRDIRRRPVSAIALFMVAAGCTGFVWVNGVITLSLIFGFEVDLNRMYAPAPIYVGLWVAGCGLLAAGDRVYEELASLYMLTRLKPLWHRVIQLMPEDFHLPTRHLPASARLQRSYVEISDAICILRIDTPRQPDASLDLETAAATIHTGEVTTDPAAPTISEALPHRTTRREDLELIHGLAKTYRRGTGASAAARAARPTTARRQDLSETSAARR